MDGGYPATPSDTQSGRDFASFAALREPFQNDGQWTAGTRRRQAIRNLVATLRALRLCVSLFRLSLTQVRHMAETDSVDRTKLAARLAAADDAGRAALLAHYAAL